MGKPQSRVGKQITRLLKNATISIVLVGTRNKGGTRKKGKREKEKRRMRKAKRKKVKGKKETRGKGKRKKDVSFF